MPPTKRPIVTAVTANGIKRKRTLVGPATSIGGGGGGGGGIKSENDDDAPSLYDEFIDLLSNPQYRGTGIANSVLKSHFESRYPDLVPIINDLTRSSRLTMSKLTTSSSSSSSMVGGETTEVYFSLLSVEEAAKLSGLDAPSRMVYQVIESSGNKGIWTVDVRIQTNIPQATLTKIFKVIRDRILLL
jgi:hypothetical protein